MTTTTSTNNSTLVILGLLATLLVFLSVSSSLWGWQQRTGGVTPIPLHGQQQHGEEFDALDVQAAPEQQQYGTDHFTSLDGEFAWDQFKVDGFVQHAIGDADHDGEEFVIVPNRDGERRSLRGSSNTANDNNEAIEVASTSDEPAGNLRGMKTSGKDDSP